MGIWIANIDTDRTIYLPSYKYNYIFAPSYEKSLKMFWSKVFGVAALAVTVAAQEQYYIDPSSVLLKTRGLHSQQLDASCPY